MDNHKKENKNHNHSCCEESSDVFNGQMSMMSHGSAGAFLHRFWVVTFLLIPLVLTNSAVIHFFNIPTFAIGKWVSFGIATIIFGFSFIFFQHAWMEIKARSYGMMTLVSIAVISGYLFSVAATFIPTLGIDFYLEISTLVWVLLFGHYLEAKSSSAAGNALQEVAKLLPKQAHLIRGEKEIDVDVSDLKIGDVVLVKPGEKIPADGVVKVGLGNVNEALISGESKPVLKKENDNLVAGSVSVDSALTVTLTRVGENSTIGQIKSLISEAQKTKPHSQKIADNASAWLTFTAGTVAILTFVVWAFVIGKPLVFAVTLAITVLVIACPHALGLAIPTVTTITTSLAVKNGFFIKNMGKIETIKKVDYVVFDKTGTLTEGVFGVSDIIPFGNYSDDFILKKIASLEQYSSHIIGISILDEVKQKNLGLEEISEFKNFEGKGISGNINGKRYFVGNKSLMESISLEKQVDENKDKINNIIEKTLVFVSDENNIIGVIALSDKIKKESWKAIEDLHSLGIKTAMLTGDNESTAKKVAESLKIDKYFSDILPEDKYKYVKKLQDDGDVVLMVGDGVNDAPALAQADAGIAIGAGTDVAVEAGDIVLMRNNPQDIVRLIILSRKVYKKMIQNLVWAFGYNIIAIPSAAGVFAFWGFFLRPEIGALVMSLSTVIVVVNAISLKRISLE